MSEAFAAFRSSKWKVEVDGSYKPTVARGWLGSAVGVDVGIIDAVRVALGVGVLQSVTLGVRVSGLGVGDFALHADGVGVFDAVRVALGVGVLQFAALGVRVSGLGVGEFTLHAGGVLVLVGMRVLQSVGTATV